MKGLLKGGGLGGSEEQTNYDAMTQHQFHPCHLGNMCSDGDSHQGVPSLSNFSCKTHFIHKMMLYTKSKTNKMKLN